MRNKRYVVQLGFLVFTLGGVYVVQGHAERWCPFGGIEALYGYLKLGNLTCSLGVSNFYVLAGLLLLTLIARRVFCGYACPIGTISEWLHLGARRLGLHSWRVPTRLDGALSVLKYGALVVILYFTARINELIFRGYDPCYALISRNGEDIKIWAYLISGVVGLGSLLVAVPFCRWLCPLAAVLNPFSKVGLTRVRRDEDACVSCGACARACPMNIPVDRLTEVTAARCTSCVECVAVCPTSVGAIRWGLPKGLGAARFRPILRAPIAAISVLLLVCLGGAVAASYAVPLPSFVRVEGTAPDKTESIRLRVRGLKCRESAESFVRQLRRDDELRIAGYLRIDAWPAPGTGSVRITFDPTTASADAIQEAITAPYFDPRGGWQHSNYALEGYDPLAH